MTLLYTLAILNLFSQSPSTDTSITGRAIDTKYGPAIIRKDTIWHLEGLPKWHDSCYGRKLTVTGIGRKRGSATTQSHAEPYVTIHEETLWLMNASFRFSESQNNWIKAAEKDILVFIKNTPVKRGHIRLFNERATNLAQPASACFVSSSSDSVFCMEPGEVIMIIDIDSNIAIGVRGHDPASIIYGNLDTCIVVKAQKLKKGDYIGKAKPNEIYPSLFTVEIIVNDTKGSFNSYWSTKDYFIRKSKEDWNIKQ